MSASRETRALPGLAVLALLLLAGCATTGEYDPGLAPSSGRLAVRGGQIYYEVAGEGPAVVLIHGGFGDRRMWDAQFHDLARDFRVIRYDHRGFGGSPTSDKLYSPVEDLLRLLNHLDVRRAHLVGNSLGGALALDFALLYPQRVGRVVVISSGASGYPFSDPEVEGVAAVFRAAREESLARAAELWLQHPMVAVARAHPEAAPLLRTMVEENQGVFLMQHWPAERLDPPAWDRLSRVRPRVLFLVGGEDTPLVRKAAEESARKVPASDLVVVPGTDHLPQMERPGVVNGLIRSFLGTR